MASKAVSGIGTMLQKGVAGSPISFATVAEVRSISWNGVKLDFADITNMDSTGNYKEWLPTLFDPGEVDFEMNYLETQGTGDTSQLALQTDFDARTKRDWQLKFPLIGSQTTNAYWSFAGYVSELSKSFAIDKQQMAICKIKVTSKPTFTLAT